MEVTIIFKIAAVGMVSLAGLLIVLFWIVPYIYELFQSIQKLFVI